MSLNEDDFLKNSNFKIKMRPIQSHLIKDETRHILIKYDEGLNKKIMQINDRTQVGKKPKLSDLNKKNNIKDQCNGDIFKLKENQYKTQKIKNRNLSRFPNQIEKFFNPTVKVLKNFKESSIFFPKIKRESISKAVDLDYIFNNILTK